MASPCLGCRFARRLSDDKITCDNLTASPDVRTYPLCGVWPVEYAPSIVRFCRAHEPARPAQRVPEPVAP